MTKPGWVIIGLAVAVFALACGGDGNGFAQPEPGLDSSDPGWVSEHRACDPDAESISIRWISSDFHDTDVVAYGGETAAWADGELCVRGQMKWDHMLGTRAGLTVRAQGQFIEDNFDGRQWLTRKAEDNAEWQKFVTVVVELAEKPEEVKIAVKLYDD